MHRTPSKVVIQNLRVNFKKYVILCKLVTNNANRTPSKVYFSKFECKLEIFCINLQCEWSCSASGLAPWTWPRQFH